MINAKKAKALRKFLRVVNLPYNHVQYQWVVQPLQDGTHRPIKRFLHPESGRAVYRRLKPLWA